MYSLKNKNHSPLQSSCNYDGPGRHIWLLLELPEPPLARARVPGSPGCDFRARASSLLSGHFLEVCTFQAQDAPLSRLCVPSHVLPCPFLSPYLFSILSCAEIHNNYSQYFLTTYNRHLTNVFSPLRQAGLLFFVKRGKWGIETSWDSPRPQTVSSKRETRIPSILRQKPAFLTLKHCITPIMCRLQTLCNKECVSITHWNPKQMTTSVSTDISLECLHSREWIHFGLLM